MCATLADFGEVAELNRDYAYDVFQIEAAKIVGHWNSNEVVAPPEQCKHSNGKF